VADLISKAFSSQQKTTQSQSPGHENGNPNPMWNGMFKLLGIDSTKISALVINGIIFIAQMVREKCV
jgi:hypothetical protein